MLDRGDFEVAPMPTNISVSTPMKPNDYRPATPPGEPDTPSGEEFHTPPFNRPATPSEEPPNFDVDEPSCEQLSDANPEASRSTSPGGIPIMKVSTSKVPMLPLPSESLTSPTPRNSSGKVPMFSLATPNPRSGSFVSPTPRNSSGKVSELVQAYEVKSIASDHSASNSPCKTSRQQVDTPSARFTPCQPTPRPSFAVKKLDDGRFIAREPMAEVDELYEGEVVDIDTGAPLLSAQPDTNKSLPFNAEITASTVEPLGIREQSSFCSLRSTSPTRQRTMSSISQREWTEDPQDVPTPSYASLRKAFSPERPTSQAGMSNGHKLSATSSCSIASVTPRFATSSFVNSVFEEALHNTIAVNPAGSLQKEEASEVSIESENRGAFSVNYKKAGVLHESMVSYSIKSCSRSLSPNAISKSKRHSYRVQCEYPDQYFLPLHPRKLITHIQDGQVCFAIMFPDPGGIFKKTSEACKAVGSSTKAALGETKKFAQTPVGKSAFTGAAVLGVAGGGGGALAGTGVGALAGIFMAPLTFGLSIPVGLCVGCSVGAGMGVTAGSAIGAAGGGVLGYVRDRRRGQLEDVRFE